MSNSRAKGLNCLPSYLLPEAEGGAPGNIIQSVCTSGFCRVLYISSHLSNAPSFFLCLFYSLYTYFLVSGLLFHFNTPQDEKSWCSAIIVNPAYLQKMCLPSCSKEWEINGENPKSPLHWKDK